MELVEKEIGRLESNLTKRGGGMVFTRGALASSRQAALEGMVGESRLADKVASILGRVEAELDAADAHIGNRLHVLDLDQDGVVRGREGKGESWDEQAGEGRDGAWHLWGAVGWGCCGGHSARQGSSKGQCFVIASMGLMLTMCGSWYSHPAAVHVACTPSHPSPPRHSP